MEKPDEELEKKLNKIGVFFVPKQIDIPKNANHLSIHLEIGFPLETELGIPDFDVMIQNKRGVKTFFTGFRTTNRNDQKLFMFEAYQEAPPQVPLHGNYNDIYVSSYIDMCWNVGTKPLDKSTAPPVITNIKDSAILVDMGWVLPSSFVDSVIEALGMLNDTILSGILIDALVYGPFVSYKE